MHKNEPQKKTKTKKKEHAFGSEEGLSTGEAVWKTPWQPIIASSKLPSSIKLDLTSCSLSLAPSSFHKWANFFSFPAHPVLLLNNNTPIHTHTYIYMTGFLSNTG